MIELTFASITMYNKNILYVIRVVDNKLNKLGYLLSNLHLIMTTIIVTILSISTILTEFNIK